MSMSSDELLSGTSAYSLQNGSHPSPPSATSSSSDELDEHLSLREAITDPLIWQRSRQATQEEMEERIENLRLRSERLNAESANLMSSLRSDSERRRILHQMVEHEDEAEDDICDHTAEDSYTDLTGISAPTPPPFTVTAATEEEEESDSNEEMPSAAALADRLRRESRWRTDSDDEDDEITPRIAPLRRARPLDDPFDQYMRHGRVALDNYMRVSYAAAPSRAERPEPAPHVEGLIAPHARFFIAKNKNKITIKFHPAM